MRGSRNSVLVSESASSHQIRQPDRAELSLAVMIRAHGNGCHSPRNDLL